MLAPFFLDIPGHMDLADAAWPSYLCNLERGTDAMAEVDEMPSEVS